ncbi:MAG: LCP family protein [Lachnospiraceae bacterium]|nr:LCP family protein [Lachnospiraceae bacterium]
MRNDSQSNGKIQYQSISRNNRGQYRQTQNQAVRGSQRRNIESYNMRQASRRTSAPGDDYDTFNDFQQEGARKESRQKPQQRSTSRPVSQNRQSSGHKQKTSSQQHRTAPQHSSSGHSGNHGGRPANPQKQKSGNGRKKKGLKKDVLAWILLGLQAALSICLIIVLLILNVLPLKFLIPVILILVILWGAIFFTQLKRYKKLPLIGKIISIILCILLAIGNYYMIITNKAIETVTEETVYNYTYLDVIVLADDPAKTIKDAKDYTFGIQATYQPLNLKTAVDEIENEVGKSIATKDYDTVMNQIDALYAKQVPAVIYNRNFKTTIESVHENFEEEVRVIKTISIKDAIDISSGSKVDVTTEPFLFYISGNDEYGEVTFEGRSDVNILVAVNPNSREILMITTPRDFYVILPDVSNGTRDKLTHAGVYGMQCQLDTLSNLYDYDIDYYCRVNFSSLIDIVDAIGGIDVYNEMEFEFDNSDGLIIPEGNVHLSGYEALCFCRERHSFEDGDAARARHQQAVIEAIINKLLSSTGFTAYSQLIKTLERCCITNMPKESISALVKKQLAEGGGWNIHKVAAEGEAFLQPTFSMGSMPLYVIMPYIQSLNNIKTMLTQVYNGEPVTELYMDEYSDYSLVDQPVPVQTIEEDEEGYTVRRSDLVDADGNVFGEMVLHVDEENDDKVMKTEYFDLNGNRLSADEVEARRKGSSNQETSADDTDDNGDDTGDDTGDDGGDDGGDDSGDDGGDDSGDDDEG